MPPVNIALRISLSFNLERLFIDISKTLQKKKKKKERVSLSLRSRLRQLRKFPFVGTPTRHVNILASFTFHPRVLLPC